MKSFFSDVTTQVYSDIALLLSQCSNVYSAEVPGAMQVCMIYYFQLFFAFFMHLVKTFFLFHLLWG